MTKFRLPYNRTRTDELGVYNKSPTAYHEVFWDGHTTDWSAAQASVRNYRTISDVVTPGYEAKQAQGSIIMNPYSAYVTETTTGGPIILDDTWNTRSYGAFNSSVQQQFDIYKPGLSYPSIALPYDLSSLKSAAIIEAFARMNDTDWSAIVDAAEMGETVDMIGKYIKPVVQLARRKPVILTAKEHRRQKFKWSNTVGDKGAGFVSNHWLEWRYGWGPLMYSIEDATKAFAKLQNGLEPVRQSFRAKLDTSGNRAARSDSIYYPFGTSYAGCPHWMTRNIMYDVTARAGVIASKELNFRNALGLRLVDLPSHTIELVPLSFVAGWFINFDRWIRANTPQPGTKVLGSWVTTVENVEDRVTWNRASATSSKGSGSTLQTWNCTAVNQWGSQKWTRVQRTVGLSPSQQPLTVNFDVNNYKHVADSASLIYQMLIANRR